MNCPYCGEKMQSGTLVGGPKGGVPRFRTDEQMRKGRMNRFLDSLGGTGALVFSTYSFWDGFHTSALFCAKCKKMIIDTDVVK